MTAPTEPMTVAKKRKPYDGPKCGGLKTDGGLCTQTAGWGTDHQGIGKCKLHFGRTKTHNRAAQFLQAKRDVELFGVRREIHPAEALLELVQWTAGEVDYWRQEVRLIERDDLTWGVTKEKSGGDDRGTTEEAKPHVAYAMLIDASNRLERYASAALKAGIEERRIQLAEGQGRLLAGVIQRILTAVYDALVGVLGPHEAARAAVEVAWAGWVGQIVPTELRALSVEGVVS